MPTPPYTTWRSGVPTEARTPTTAVVHPTVPAPVHPAVPAPVAHPGHGPVIHHGPVYPPSQPPPAHQRHRDYRYVEGWGWWPTWFPYWDQGWLNYWNYLYDYYGGDAYAEYAEYMRDAAMRQLAAQRGWIRY